MYNQMLIWKSITVIRVDTYYTSIFFIHLGVMIIYISFAIQYREDVAKSIFCWRILLVYDMAHYMSR